MQWGLPASGQPDARGVCQNQLDMPFMQGAMIRKGLKAGFEQGVQGGLRSPRFYAIISPFHPTTTHLFISLLWHKNNGFTATISWLLTKMDFKEHPVSAPQAFDHRHLMAGRSFSPAPRRHVSQSWKKPASKMPAF